LVEERVVGKLKSLSLLSLLAIAGCGQITVNAQTDDAGPAAAQNGDAAVSFTRGRGTSLTGGQGGHGGTAGAAGSGAGGGGAGGGGAAGAQGSDAGAPVSDAGAPGSYDAGFECLFHRDCRRDGGEGRCDRATHTCVNPDDDDDD
jgi:hypothetical protein